MSQDIPDSPHLQAVHNTHVCHDGHCGLSWIRILQECEACQSTRHGHVVIAVCVAEAGTGLVFVALVCTHQVIYGKRINTESFNNNLLRVIMVLVL